ncbi:hypothetical protein FF38_12690 [Lucilia cuprina]|uniref:Uncharacterized protein n=1 Tax=Lucilia cuprina TaxID=7375 RepID=A0A0L0C4E2_LUCCU|nr:hypothetical protein FF38_12690 [Lucilia cuprina]
MKASKIFSIFVLILQTQTSFCKPNEESTSISELEDDLRNDSLPQKQMIVIAYDQLMALGREYIDRSAEISRNILKDESLMLNEKPEVVEFKKNLKVFVESNDNSKKKDVFTIWTLISVYVQTIENYVELSEEKITPESKFILEIINKYDCHTVNMEYRRKFNVTVDDFTRKFEEHKEHMNEHVLQWFKTFKALTKFDEKLETLTDFMFMLT